MQPKLKNRTIFCHDNLEVLRGLDSESIDLIYLDPPFNKGKVFAAPIGSSAEGASFKDFFRKEDVKDEWVSDLMASHEQVGSFLAWLKSLKSSQSNPFFYLAYMAVRLVDMRRILKSTGSLYWHCDPTMSHYLKILLDLTFGEKNFRNEIVWGYEKPRSSSRVFRRNHDIILFYTKGPTYPFNVQRVPTIKGGFDMRKPFKRPDGTTWHPKEPGKQAGSWWYDIPSFATRMGARERTGYPTQKPLALLERIIKASCPEEGLVLDPFCGCATTCVAAEKLGRKWLGIDLSKASYNLARDRLAAETKMDKNESIELRTTPPTRTT